MEKKKFLNTEKYRSNSKTNAGHPKAAEQAKIVGQDQFEHM